MLNKGTVCLLTLRHLPGKMQDAVKAVPLARAKSRMLQSLQNTLRDEHQNLALSSTAQADLSWWIHLTPSQRCKPIQISPPSLTLTTDPSNYGWGATCNGHCNVYRSALSSTLLVRSDKLPVEQSSTVMAGVYNERPLQPRYTETWCVASVSHYLAVLDNQSISLGQLAEKLVMLMALARAPRVSTIRLLSIQNMRRQPNGIQFVLTQPNKKRRVGSAPKKFFVPSFPRDSSLCPAVCLDEHLSQWSVHINTSPLSSR